MVPRSGAVCSHREQPQRIAFMNNSISVGERNTMMKMKTVLRTSLDIRRREVGGVWLCHPALKALSVLMLLSILLVSACTPEAASRWAEAQATAQVQQATEKAAIAGGEFNALFPE